MQVMNSSSLCTGAQPLVSGLLLGIKFVESVALREFHGRYYPTIVSMQSHSHRKFPSPKAVGSTRALVTKGFGFVSKSKRSVFACNAALNAKCSQGQTQTVTRESPTITQAPTHGKEKSPKLDDGGSGFPPRDDGGGGGGGGGGESFSGGFFLFGFLMFMGYLKDLEGEHENSH